MKRSYFTIGLVIFLSIYLGSCSAINSRSGWQQAAKQIEITRGEYPEKCPETASKRVDTLVIGYENLTGLINPLWIQNLYESPLSLLIFGSLIEPDYDGKPISGMADCVISRDNLIYTFTLKEGVKFSDGTPVTARDIEFTYYILCDPSYNGPNNLSHIDVVGADAYYSNKSDTIQGIKVINDRTIEIRIENPNAHAIWFLGGSVLSKEYYGPYYSKGNLENIFVLNEKPLGAGPYRLVEFKPGQNVTLNLNEHYFKGMPKINNVVFLATPSGKELEKIKSGEIDMVFPSVSDENIAIAKASGFIDIYKYPTSGYGYIGINNHDPKFSDKIVRQALIQALNRKTIVETAFGPYAEVINIPQSKLSWSYTDEGISKYEYDLKKAEKLLKEAGWIKNNSGNIEKDGMPFKVKFSAIPGHPVTEAILPIMIKDYETLGIEIEVEYVDFTTLVDMVEAGQAHMWFLAWGLNIDPDPYIVYGSDGEQNYYHYSNYNLDALMSKANKTTNIRERKKLYKKIYSIINEDVPCLWLYQRSDMWFVNSRVKDIRLSPYRNFAYELYQTRLELK